MDDRALERWCVAAVAALTVFGGWLRLANLGVLSFWSDDGFTYLAVQGILDRGIPVLPSGSVYWKNALFSYLTAVPCLFFGINETTLRLFNAVCGVAVIPAAYFAARRPAGRLAALVLAALLTTSVWEVEFSREARYYGCFQLLSLLTIACFQRAYLSGEETHRPAAWSAAVCMAGATLVQVQGATLWVLFPLLACIRGRKRLTQRNVLVPALAAATLVSAWIVFSTFFWKVGFVVRPGKGVAGAVASLLDEFSWKFFAWWWKLFPALTLAGILSVAGIVSLAVARRIGRNRWESIALFGGYLVLTLGIMGFGRVHYQPRYIQFLYPVFLFVPCVALRVLIEEAARNLSGRLRHSEKVAGLVFVLAVVALSNGSDPREALAVTSRGYGDEIQEEFSPSTAHRFHDDHQGPGLFVRDRLRPEDVVVGMHPIFAYIYAGRCDRWLWTAPPGIWDAYHKDGRDLVDNYLGTRLLRSADGLKSLIRDTLARGATVWVITTPSIQDRFHISRSISRFLRSRRDAVVLEGRDGVSQVFAFSPGESS